MVHCVRLSVATPPAVRGDHGTLGGSAQSDAETDRQNGNPSNQEKTETHIFTSYWHFLEG